MDKQAYLKIRSELDFVPKLAALRNQILLDIGLLTGAGGLLLKGSLFGYLASQALLACLYFRAFSAMHEAVHGGLSKNQRFIRWLGVVYGGVCFLPYSTWRAVHLDHHSWAGNAQMDPVMKIVRDFPSKPPLSQKIHSHLWRTWIPYLAFLQQVVFWSASVKLIPKEARERRLETLSSVAAPLFFFCGLLLAGFALGNIGMLLPSVLIYLVLVEVVNFPHHLGLPRVSGEEKLSLQEQYKISRTCIYSAWFSHFVLLNFNYHAEHHMFPTLPWHELPVAHTKVRAINPEGYEMGKGHEWIRLNRRKDLKEVLAPTKLLKVGNNRKPGAAA